MGDGVRDLLFVTLTCLQLKLKSLSLHSLLVLHVLLLLLLLVLMREPCTHAQTN